MRENKLLLGLMFLCVIIACSHRTKYEYASYVQEEKNGLNKKVLVDNWEYIAQYKPTEYIISYEEENDKTFNAELRRKQLKGTLWFNITIKNLKGSSSLRENSSSAEDYNKKYGYYLNEAKDNITLVYNGLTLKPISYVFENNFDMAPLETLVVGFALPVGDSIPCYDVQLIYKDVLLENGIIKFLFNKTDLNTLPEYIHEKK